MARFERSERAPQREIERLANRIRQLQAQVSNPFAFSKAVGETLVAQTLERFDTKKGPDEKAWQPWATSYAKTRRAGDSLLIDNSTHDPRYPHLKDSIKWNATADGVTVSSEGVPYSGFVQKTRQYLGLSRSDVSELEATVLNVLGTMVEEPTPKPRRRK